MPLILPRIKKINLKKRRPKIKRGSSRRRLNGKSIYLVYYDIQNFSIELTHPIITFRKLEAAEIYVQNKNFEFQALMLASRNAQQSFVLDSIKSIFNQDFCITVSDLRLAGDYFYEEYHRHGERLETEEAREILFWDILNKYITPFRLSTIEYRSRDYK